MFSILIVEDEYLVRQGIRSLVDFKSYQVGPINEAENGLIAWQMIQEEQPDILLTDINMPQMNGIQLAGLVKEAYPDTHIVFLTGYDEFDYALSALKLGADDYLLKPFSKEDVEEMIAKVVKKLSLEHKSRHLKELVQESQASELGKRIEAHLDDSEFSLKSLAQELGFSPNHLSLLIKKELGIPFQDYLVQVRIKQAKLLLLTTDLKIYEIAERCGFEDINYFSQRFKHQVGQTPRQFRKGEGNQ